ncbi:DUF4301 family protein [Flavobacterium sp.]|uniref:DUF4301 family protein n=1 Tax=Flavobacterium sp. TaxID=239 RepID=UPI00286BA44B|nr:DUF4301 family protein [Flavobacterium sp.]
MEENLKQQQTNIIKIALFGPESTGKTTLSKELAQHFDTVWIPEFARDYLQEKLDKTGEICVLEDLLPIAIGQTKLENESLALANNYLFCDTNLLVTKVFSEIYYNHCDPILDKAARKHKYDLFFLTNIDVPWEDDGLRDSPENRQVIFDTFKTALETNNKPYILLSGDKKSRLKQAISIINDFTATQKMGFSSQDFVQIYQHGIPLENIKNQLQIFKTGIAKTILEKPAILNDGILHFSEEEFREKALFFDTKKENLKLKKFVPASGAASRMFKFLSTFLNEFDLENESINAYINRKKDSELSIFIVGMEKFPFFEAIYTKLRENFTDFNTWERDRKNYYFIKLLLSSDYFDFINKPKGVLPFHKYKTHIATAIEEHLHECAYYSISKGNSHLHFTVSESHQGQFESIIETVKNQFENESKVKITTTYSYQDKTTDTIAVDLKNNPYRDENNQLIFRPGGHGALIENLNRLEADIIFIKNIDNVIQNHIEIIALYKKALAGILLELQQQIFKYLDEIGNSTEQTLLPIITFVKNKLNAEFVEDFSKYTLENKINFLINILNRPIRVCGMVKNEGEPGGGPFWVLNLKGISSLQIVETSQVDLTNSNQCRILGMATHFNPVDIVCGIKNHKGVKFNLIDFVDKNSGFVVEKNKNGNHLKGYELPGLWNGAMASWTTIFVEVPLLTFNPVKTVNDLLKPAHQPQ